MSEVDVESADLCLAELVKGKPYICKTWAEPQTSEKNDKKVETSLLISLKLMSYSTSCIKINKLV